MLIKKNNLNYTDFPYVAEQFTNRETYEKMEERMLEGLFAFMEKNSMKQMWAEYSGGHDDGCLDNEFTAYKQPIITIDKLGEYTYSDWCSTPVESSELIGIPIAKIEEFIPTETFEDKHKGLHATWHFSDMIYNWLPSFDGEPATRGVVLFDLETTSVHIYNQEQITSFIDADSPSIYKLEPTIFQIDENSILKEFLEEPDNPL